MFRLVALATLLLALSGCVTPPAAPSASSQSAPPTGAKPAPLSATLVLDWFPNTNHIGIYLAQARGWYAEQGLDLKIEAPSDVSASTKLVAAGNAELGISYEPAVIIARSQDVPLVSVAALVQHNLGAIAAKKESGITRPKDFEGKRFGSSGIAQAQMQLQTVMRCDKADPQKTEEVTLGQGLSQAMLADRVDFMSLLPTWEGIELELKGTQLNYINYRDWCLPDAYNLVFVSSENTIRDKPDILKRFVAATQRGYEYGVKNPEEAASTLLKAAPDLNPALVKASLERLNPFFIGEAPRWGVQEAGQWKGYADWMYVNKLIQKPVDASKAFTSQFMPAQ
jgi:ABC-type nitrate/sulfonate/bicarbonate transport system substrate-binding protein